MKRTTTILTALIVLCSTMAVASPVSAQYGAYTGGTKDTGIVVDKQVSVKNPKDFELKYVDNLSAEDVRYAPEDTVTFTIRVRNTSQKAYGTAVIRDFLPDYLVPVKYEFTKGSRTITIAAGSLKSNEEKTFTIATKVVKNEELPQDKTVICIVNKAQVDAAGVSDQDTSQFCIERQVQGAKTVPAAGAETQYTALALAMIGSGLYLRRKSGIIES